MLMFGSFTTWRSHEIDHRRQWICPVCHLECSDKLKTSMHLSKRHAELAKHTEVDMILQTSSRPPEYLSADDCPFCDWSTALRKRDPASSEHNLTVPSRRFMKHLGRHLEEIALFVVPQPEEDQQDLGDVGSNAVHATQDGKSNIASTLSSFNSATPSIASIHAENDHEDTSSESNKSLCPYPTCGRHFKDLKAHIYTHQNERPFQCPIQSCEYHTKGFAREYDQTRHTLTHYQGTIVCGFCPSSGPGAEKSFNRAEVFKRHLTSVHGAEQTPPSARNRPSSVRTSHISLSHVPGKCSTCGNTFENAQDIYEHLDACILRVLSRAQRPKTLHDFDGHPVPTSISSKSAHTSSISINSSFSNITDNVPDDFELSEEQCFFVMYFRVLEELSWPEIEDKFGLAFNLRFRSGLSRAYPNIRKRWGMDDSVDTRSHTGGADRDKVESHAAHFSREFLENIGYFD